MQHPDYRLVRPLHILDRGPRDMRPIDERLVNETERDIWQDVHELHWSASRPRQ